MENSPLKLLAPELRNRIYELALTSDDSIDLSGIVHHNQLTRTCRQVRQECWKMFWASNHFRLVIHSEDDKHLLAHQIFGLLGHSLAPVLSLIPSIEISTFYGGRIYQLALRPADVSDNSLIDGTWDGHDSTVRNMDYVWEGTALHAVFMQVFRAYGAFSFRSRHERRRANSFTRINTYEVNMVITPRDEVARREN